MFYPATLPRVSLGPNIERAAQRGCEAGWGQEGLFVLHFLLLYFVPQRQVSFYFNSQQSWAFTALLSADHQASEQARTDFVTLRGKEGELEVPLERSLHSYQVTKTCYIPEE